MNYKLSNRSTIIINQIILHSLFNISDTCSDISKYSPNFTQVLDLSPYIISYYFYFNRKIVPQLSSSDSERLIAEIGQMHWFKVEGHNTHKVWARSLTFYLSNLNISITSKYVILKKMQVKQKNNINGETLYQWKKKVTINLLKIFWLSNIVNLPSFLFV